MISFNAEEHLTFDHNSQTVVALLLLSCAVNDVFPVNAGILLDYFVICDIGSFVLVFLNTFNRLWWFYSFELLSTEARPCPWT